MINTTWINGLTKDYSLVNGVYQKKSNLLTECYTRFVTPIGSWIIDPTFGSLFPSWINTRTRITSNKAIQELDRIYQPIVNQNRAQSIKSVINTLADDYSSIGITVYITDLSQQTLQLNLSIGG